MSVVVDLPTPPFKLAIAAIVADIYSLSGTPCGTGGSDDKGV